MTTVLHAFIFLWAVYALSLALVGLVIFVMAINLFRSIK